MRKKRSKIWLISEASFRCIIEKSLSMTDALQKLGLENKGGNHRTFKERMLFLGYSFDAFKKAGQDASLKALRSNIQALPLESILVENSSYARHHLKRRILQHNLIPYVCDLCKQTNSWNKQPLVLVLDHINGIYNDNRLENLRFLCPNCNSQQSTFAGKNKRENHS